jgi:hypothetical protein
MEAGVVAQRLTLVTLGCRPFAIATSVREGDAAVYSPAVLRPRDQTWEPGTPRAMAELPRTRKRAWSGLAV